MIDLEEQLRRIIEGSAMFGPQGAPNPDEGMGLEEIRAAGAGMTEAGGEDLETAAPPTRQPLRPVPTSAPQEKVVQVPMSAPKSPDDLEAAYARAQDKDARRRMAMERGGRELVAGLTRTTPQSVIERPTDAFSRYAAAQKEKRAATGQADQLSLGRQKADFETKEAARKAAEDKARDERDFGYRQKHDADTLAQSAKNADATRALAGAGLGIRRDEAEAKAQEREDKAGAGAMPVLGGTLTLTPGLGDAERNKARETAGLWNAADAAVENFQGTLEEFARTPSVESKGRVTAALRTASSAFNSAIGGGAMSMDEARAMSEALGADVLTPTGLAALVQSFSGNEAEAARTVSNRVRAARQANRAAALGRLKTYGTYSEGGGAAKAPGGRKIVKNPKTGERRYLNADGSLGEAVP